jgi:hypothetical protein
MRVVEEEAHIYDIYIMTFGGLPLYGGCTNSTFCLQHVGQHALHCGFFAAMKSFCQEAFGQYQVSLIEMDDIKLHLLTVPALEVMAAGVYPKSVADSTARDQLEVMMQRFTEKYSQNITAGAVCDQSIFDQFTEDLVELGIIPNANVHCSIPIQFEEGTQKVNMPSLPV